MKKAAVDNTKTLHTVKYKLSIEQLNKTSFSKGQIIFDTRRIHLGAETLHTYNVKEVSSRFSGHYIITKFLQCM